MNRLFTRIFFYVLAVSLFGLPGYSVLANVDVSTSTTIYLDIESATSTLFAGPVTVSACSVTASSTPTLNAYCAVRQTGLESDWSAYGDDLFLNSISGVASDYVTNQYWNWFSNLEYGQTSLSQHILAPNEKILITIGRLPLKITVSTTTPIVDDTLVVNVWSFGFDSSWNGVWSPFASSSLKIGDGLLPTSDAGFYETFISTTTSFTITAQALNYIDSNVVNIFPVEKLVIVSTTTATTTIATTTATTTDQVSTGSNISGENSHHPVLFDIEKALDFIISKQQSDGSFGASLYTDWVALALASDGRNSEKNKLKAYLKEAEVSLSSATDYERHAMALMALGINPYTGTDTNYIQKIIDEFDGEQVGDKDLVNDDIFALFPLLKAGYSNNDQIIKSIVATVISTQENDGSWNSSIDLTAAGIQSLSLVEDLPGVKEALNKARDYLLEQQDEDGGFDSSFSTSWVLQAIYSLHGGNADWSKGGKTPEEFLAEEQQADGGVEDMAKSDRTRLWATAYAVIAVRHLPWIELLSSFSKPDVISNNLEEEERLSTSTAVTALVPVLSPVELSTSSELIDISLVLSDLVIMPIEKPENRLEVVVDLPIVKKSPVFLAAAVGQTSFSPKSSGIVILILLLLGLLAGIYFSKIKKN